MVDSRMSEPSPSPGRYRSRFRICVAELSSPLSDKLQFVDFVRHDKLKKLIGHQNNNGYTLSPCPTDSKTLTYCFDAHNSPAPTWHLVDSQAERSKHAGLL